MEIVVVDIKARESGIYSANCRRNCASDSGGTIWVYSPPVGNGIKGRTIPVNSGPKRVGLAEAKKRLEGVE